MIAKNSKARLSGFTLIELLVALFIAALMFAMGYGAINQTLRSRGPIRRRQESLLALETAMRVIEQDLIQLAPRPSRSPDGTSYLPCLQGNAMSNASESNTSASSPLVALTRNGWSNPAGLRRSELERVAYIFDDGTLVREHWNVLDATLSSTPVKRNLLTHLRSVTFQYMLPQTRAWVDAWPPRAVSDESIRDSYYRLRPLAVKVTLDTQQWGEIDRIFEVAH